METYVDRDRMIAVSIGASDIRSSILKQKGDYGAIFLND